MIEYEYYYFFQLLHYRLRSETQKIFLTDFLQENDACSSLFKLVLSYGGGKILSTLEEFEIFLKWFHMYTT